MIKITSKVLLETPFSALHTRSICLEFRCCRWRFIKGFGRNNGANFEVFESPRLWRKNSFENTPFMLIIQLFLELKPSQWHFATQNGKKNQIFVCCSANSTRFFQHRGRHNCHRIRLGIHIESRWSCFDTSVVASVDNRRWKLQK